MLNLFAHAGHNHDASTMSALDHCLPIIIGASIVIVVLLGIIAYLLTTRQPKTQAKPVKKKSPKA